MKHCLWTIHIYTYLGITHRWYIRFATTVTHKFNCLDLLLDCQALVRSAQAKHTIKAGANTGNQENLATHVVPSKGTKPSNETQTLHQNVCSCGVLCLDPTWMFGPKFCGLGLPLGIQVKRMNLFLMSKADSRRPPWLGGAVRSKKSGTHHWQSESAARQSEIMFCWHDTRRQTNSTNTKSPPMTCRPWCYCIAMFSQRSVTMKNKTPTQRAEQNWNTTQDGTQHNKSVEQYWSPCWPSPTGNCVAIQCCVLCGQDPEKYPKRPSKCVQPTIINHHHHHHPQHRTRIIVIIIIIIMINIILAIIFVILIITKRRSIIHTHGVTAVENAAMSKLS